MGSCIHVSRKPRALPQTFCATRGAHARATGKGVETKQKGASRYPRSPPSQFRVGVLVKPTTAQSGKGQLTLSLHPCHTSTTTLETVFFSQTEGGDAVERRGRVVNGSKVADGIPGVVKSAQDRQGERGGGSLRKRRGGVCPYTVLPSSRAPDPRGSILSAERNRRLFHPW